MSDSEVESGKSSVTRIPRFYGRRGDDYGLWRLRSRAACRVQGIWSLVENDSSRSTGTDSTCGEMSTVSRENQSSRQEKASGIIISALGDSPLRVLSDQDGNPARMLQMLDARYASNRTVSRITVQTQLYRMKYKGQDMSRYIDEYTALFSQL